MPTSAILITAANPLNETTHGRQKSNHPMSFAWSLQPLIGICGTLLNSFVLYMGYVERQTFIRPVNAMIWYVPVNFFLAPSGAQEMRISVRSSDEKCFRAHIIHLLSQVSLMSGSCLSLVNCRLVKGQSQVSPRSLSVLSVLNSSDRRSI